MLDLDPGARRLGELGLGLNRGIDRFTGSILFDEKIGGTVHLALGQSYPETGGRQRLGPALGPDRRHADARPDHRRRPGRDGKRTLAGGLDTETDRPPRYIGDCDMRRGTSLSCPILVIACGGPARLADDRRRTRACGTGGGVGRGPASDRVLQLVERLDADKAETREAAMASSDQARPQDPAAPARPGHAAEPASARIGSRSSATALRKAAGRDQPRRQPGHDRGQGNPADRGPPAAPEADRQRDHRPARAARRRGDQPGPRPRDPRQAVLRGAGPRSPGRPRSSLNFSTGDGSIGIKSAMTHRRRHHPANGEAADPVHRAVPHRAEADRA